MNQKVFDEVQEKLSQALAQSPLKDIERNARAVLQNAFTRLDLVPREAFELQEGVLMKTREKLEALEARVAELERKLAGGD